MSRSLFSFLLFLLVLAAAAGFVVWWLSPSVVRLAVDESRRNEPYYLVQLLSGDRADSPLDMDYLRRLAGLVTVDEGELLWRADRLRLLEGRVEDEWRELQVFRFNRGGDLLQMVTSADYRELVVKGRRLLLGAPAKLQPLAGNDVLVLWLLDKRDGAGSEALPADSGAVAGSPLGEDILARLEQHAGRIVWDTPLDYLGQPNNWDWLVLLSFPDDASAGAWFRLPASTTNRVLANRVLRRQAWLLLRNQRAHPAG